MSKVNWAAGMAALACIGAFGAYGFVGRADDTAGTVVRAAVTGENVATTGASSPAAASVLPSKSGSATPAKPVSAALVQRASPLPRKHAGIKPDDTRARLTVRQHRDPRIDPLIGYDWAAYLRPKSSCTKKTSDGWNKYAAKLLDRVDVTNDGYLDYLVWGRCPGPTSSWPEMLFVIDGASERSSPRVLGLLADDYWRHMKVSVEGKGKNATVLMTGGAVSDKGPLCCSDLKVTAKYHYEKGVFKRKSHNVVHVGQF